MGPNTCGPTGWPPRAPVRGPGAPTGHRPRAAADGAAARRRRRARCSCSTATCRCSRRATLQALLQVHQAERAAATVLTALVERPYGYGRIVRTQGHRAHRRGAGCLARRARHQGDQRRHLCLRPRAAVPALRSHRLAERAGRVLPDRPGCDLPPAAARGRDADGGGRRRRSAASTAAPSWRKWVHSCDRRRTKS